MFFLTNFLIYNLKEKGTIMQKKLQSLTFIMALLYLGVTIGSQDLGVQANGETTYNLTYELYGGANHGSNPTSYTASSNITLQPATKSNLAFYGWYASQSYLEEDLVKTLPGKHLGVTKLYAKYGPSNYQITLDYNDGTAPVTKPSETLYTVPGTVTWSVANTENLYYFSFTRDLNNDGNDDFIGYTSSVAKQRHIFINNGNDTFTKFTAAFIPTASNSTVWSAEYADFDGDGKSDLITFYENNVISLSRGVGDGETYIRT